MLNLSQQEKFIRAAKKGDVEKLQETVGYVLFMERWEAFLYAAKKGILPTLKFLVQNGVSVDTQDYGYTAIHAAVEGNQLDAVKFLIEEQKAFPNTVWEKAKSKGVECKQTPLQLATKLGHTAIQTYLEQYKDVKRKACFWADIRGKWFIVNTAQELAHLLKTDDNTLCLLMSYNLLKKAFGALSYEQSKDVYETIRSKIDRNNKQELQAVIRDLRHRQKS